MSTDGDHCPICGAEYGDYAHQCHFKRRDRALARVLWIAAGIVVLVAAFVAGAVYAIITADDLQP